MKTWRIFISFIFSYLMGSLPSSSTVTRGSRLHSPMQPEVVTMTSVVFVSSITCISALSTSRAPEAMPQVPMWTVTLARWPPSRRAVWE